MRRRALAAALCAASVVVVSPARAAETRYSLAGGCFTLSAGGQAVAPADSPFHMQATSLGRYLLFSAHGDFLAHPDGSRVGKPGPDAVWEVGDDLSVRNVSTGESLGVVAFSPATGCAEFPESEVDATGTPSRGRTPWSGVRGLLDMHLHGMVFEAFGGAMHCGRPWSPFGITVALGTCTDPTSSGNITETVQAGPGALTADRVGWPTFKSWPAHDAILHEGFYWKWLERAWRAGLRVYTNLLVDNDALCTVAPVKPYGCNEMDSVRRQMRDVYALQDYIDAQNGGPGKGWYRVVTDPFQARRVINEGKLAVVLGIETSQLFDCKVYNDQPGCDVATIDREFDEMYRGGVRQMELINKFDNALAGVAGDAGTTGVFTNTGNKLETGKYWQLQHCSGPAEESDKEQLTLPGVARDSVPADLVSALLPLGTLPNYPAPPHCNARPLTTLGEYVVRKMMKRGMIIDPDHLDVISRKRVLDLVEAARYSGIVSSHSWSTTDAYPRIYRAGGIITPYAGDTKTFAQAWRKLRAMRDPRYLFGFGYGSDMNGVAEQGGPRNGPDPVTYPFKSFDGAVTLGRLRAGERTWDVNRDGLADYGLYPDWIEDLRHVAGPSIIADMARGPEAYLEMWERSVGISRGCRSARLRFTPRGLGAVLLRAPAEEVLRGAGQPARRGSRRWSWCVSGRLAKARVVTVFSRGGAAALIASDAPGHRVAGVGAGARASRVPRDARPAGPGLLVRDAGRGRRFVYGVRDGRVRFVALASRAAARSRATLRSYVRLARVGA